jgi:beta-galactosidase
VYKRHGLIKDIAQWKIAGLYAKCVDVKVTKKETQATIACIYNLATIPRADLKVNYTVNGEGKVTTQMTYEGAELNHMPAFGMTFKMAKDYDNVKWYGNGPEETYQDRKSGAKIGIYQNKVEDNMARYVIPQECGNKTEVRWAEITDLTGAGVKIAGDIPFEFSALPYTCHELDNAYHHYELPVSHYTVFNINKVQMGVGGDDSWMTQVHEEYRIPANKALSFTFSIEKLEK